MDQIKRLHDGRLYRCDDKEFLAGLDDRMAILDRLNATGHRTGVDRTEIYKEFFGGVGKNLTLMMPFYASWGYNIFWGDDCFGNFNLCMVDDAEIRLGNTVLFGPNVTVTTTGHATDPELRRNMAQFSIPVTIGNNVWIGANSVVLPGVTIGDDSVIGAGSVVTRDIPSGVVAFGNPCRVVREIGDRDREFYFRDRRVDLKV